MNKKQQHIILLLLIGVLISLFLSSGLGAVLISVKSTISAFLHPIGIEIWEHTTEEYLVFWHIRFPRVLFALVIGGSLAVTGAAMQGLFRNPLADPSIIGISGGSAMAAALFIVFGGGLLFSIPFIGEIGLSIFAFLGALLTTALVFLISIKRGNSDVSTMLLAGIAINALAGAVTGFLTFLANDEQLRDLTFWTLGSLGGATWKKLGLVTAIILIPLFQIIRHSKSLNALALGEEEASHLGVNSKKLKRSIVVNTAIIMGTTVAFCGIIGFIGLVVPHILRAAGGANNHFVLLGSLFGGMLLLLCSDTIARSIAAPSEIPLGVITSLAGAPVFLSLLVRKKLKN